MKRFCWLIVLILLIFSGCESKKATPQQKFGDVAGIVYAMGTRLPIPDAVAICNGATATSDANGAYHFLSVPVGARELSVSKAGYSTYNTSVDVEEGGNTLDVCLTTTNATIVFYRVHREDKTARKRLPSDKLCLSFQHL